MLSTVEKARYISHKSILTHRVDKPLQIIVSSKNKLALDEDHSFKHRQGYPVEISVWGGGGTCTRIRDKIWKRLK